MDKIRIGIDLGTTNTLACYMKSGKPTLVKFASEKMLPSVLYLNEAGEIIVGRKAERLGGGDPRNCIRSSKTHMGDFQKTWTLRGQEFTPTDVATEILREVRAQTMKRLKAEDAEIEAVITVPAYFNSNQIDETKKAGERAGLSVLGIITEPRAAAIANIKELGIDEEKIFVVDLGGGTFDVSILAADGSGYNTVAVDGDRHLGGDDLDQILADHIQRQIEEDLGLDLQTAESSGLSYGDYYSMMWRIRDAAKDTKEQLSEEAEVEIDGLANLFPYKDGHYSPELSLSRAEFYRLGEGLFAKVRSRVRKVLTESSIRPEEIDHIILAGGSCYIPKIREDMQEIFGTVPDATLDTSTMVAIGACFIADAWDDIHEDTGRDIISHSLGIEVMEDGGQLVLEKLLERGRSYPCEGKKIFTTTTDNQATAPITVYEAGSDREDVKELQMKDGTGHMVPVHDLYGSFVLEGIQRAPKGVPQIEVTFRYDESRLLTVTAEDLTTGAKKEVTVKKGQHIQAPAPQQRPIDFALLMDTSGSMTGVAMKQAKAAAHRLIRDIIDLSVHRLAVVEFGCDSSALWWPHLTRARIVLELSHDRRELLRAIDGLKANGYSTPMDEAFSMGMRCLSDPSRRKVLLLVTDGIPDDQKETSDQAKQAIAAGADIITISAVTNQTHAEYLKTLASRPEFSYTIQSMSQLSDMFQTAIDSYLALRG